MPIQSCGQSFSAQRGKRYTEVGVLPPPRHRHAFITLDYRIEWHPMTWQARVPSGRPCLVKCGAALQAGGFIDAVDQCLLRGQQILLARRSLRTQGLRFKL
jgi:hypothetical protein